MRVATFNMENLFCRPRVMNAPEGGWGPGKAPLTALADFNALIEKPAYSAADKSKMLAFIRKHVLGSKPLFRLNEVRGRLYAPSKKEIAVNGRDEWVGWVEYVDDDIRWGATENTARVVDAVQPDVLIAVEVENRDAMQRFNDQVLEAQGWTYPYDLLVDGNDTRGIDIGLFSRFPIRSVRAHFDDEDAQGVIFSRDCPEFEVDLPSGKTLWVLGNHFKSKGHGTPASTTVKRLRQARRVNQLYRQALQRSAFVIVAGDLNDTPSSTPIQALVDGTGLLDVMSHSSYQGKPGTYGSGSAGNKLDYVLLSPELQSKVQMVGVERRGVYAPNSHTVFPGLTRVTQASDHACVWVDLNL